MCVMQSELLSIKLWDFITVSRTDFYKIMPAAIENLKNVKQ